MTRGVKRHTVNVLNLDVMGPRFHLLAVSFIFLVSYTTLEGLFVNTLLYRITPELSIVILYRGITYAATAVAMNIGAFISRRYGSVGAVRAGCILYLIMYAVLFFGMDHMKILMYPTAILSGSAGGVFWVGFNSLITLYTQTRVRDIGISILGVIQGVGTLFVPVLTGGVISLTETLFASTDIGYRVMFGAGMILAAAQVRYQRRLPQLEQIRKKPDYGLAFRLCLRRKTIRNGFLCDFIRGVREGPFIFLLNMVLFELVTSESLVGLNAFFTGAAYILGAWAYGKLVTHRSRTRYILMGTTSLMLVCGLMFVSPSVAVIMFFAVVNSFFSLFLVNTTANSTIDALTENALSRKVLSETLAIRETFLEVGRIIGLSLFMLFPSDMKIIAMLALTATQYLLAGFMWRGWRISRYRKRQGTA